MGCVVQLRVRGACVRVREIESMKKRDLNCTQSRPCVAIVVVKSRTHLQSKKAVRVGGETDRRTDGQTVNWQNIITTSRRPTGEPAIKGSKRIRKHGHGHGYKHREWKGWGHGRKERRRTTIQDAKREITFLKGSDC